MTTPTPPAVDPGERASIGRVLKDQRKAVLVALGLAIAVVWVAGQFGEWRLAGCIAGGIGLGMVNHLATEYWLLRIIANGQQPTRATMMRSTLVRLLVLTTVALALAVVWWPEGIGLLLGLAVFRLIALVMTTIPLLKELKSQ
ncbi:MAG: hypothetical protein ACRDO4_03630 [Nocardioides sp.]